MRLSIAYHTSRWKEPLSSIATVVYCQAREMARRGHRIVILAPSPQAPPPAGVELLPLADGTLGALRGLAAAMKAGSFDVLHSHTAGVHGGGLWWMRRSASTPLAVTPHSFKRLESPSWNLRFGLRQADRVLCVSRAALELALLAGASPDRSAVLPNGVEIGDLPAPGAMRRFGDRPFVAALGRLVKIKGYDVLLEALSRVRGLDCIIGGEGEERGALESLIVKLGIQDRVRLAGWLDPAAKRDLLAEALFCVQPSLRENAPLTVLEYFAAGRTCVGSRVGGLPEVVEHEGNGLLVPPGDAEALAAGMRRLAGDGPLRARLELEAREQARRHSWGEIAIRLEAVYRDMADKKKP